MVQGQGSVIRASLSDEPTLENVEREWHKIIDMSKARRMRSSADARQNLVEKLEYLGSNKKIASDTFSFRSKHLILYALGSELYHQSMKFAM